MSFFLDSGRCKRCGEISHREKIYHEGYCDKCKVEYMKEKLKNG